METKVLPALLIGVAIAFASALPAQAETKGGTWTKKAPLPAAIEGPGTAVIDGKIYAVSGGALRDTGEEIPSLNINWMYDPAKDQWQERAPLPKAMSHVGVAALGGKLYAIGGFTGIVHRDPQDLAFVYDPKTDQWSALPKLSKPRGSVAVVAVGNKLHIFGGRVSDKLVRITPPGAPEIFEGMGIATTHEIYDPATGKWSEGKPVPAPGRDHVGIAVLNGKVHLFGGRVASFNDVLDRHDVYDPKTDTWASAAPLPRPRSDGAHTVLGGHILYAGGECKPGGKAFTPNTYDDVTAYDPKTDSWSTLTPLPVARHGVGAATVGNVAYFMGGSAACGGGATTDVFALTFP